MEYLRARVTLPWCLEITDVLLDEEWSCSLEVFAVGLGIFINFEEDDFIF